ncbi:MAG: hypothetical protein HC830_04725 [Bacteroidetes bacterium]|nr:hypothetical protein [Bacteroidota bacterium]
MKISTFIFVILVLAIEMGNCQQNAKRVQFKGNVPDFYKHYSPFTDPGEYALFV